MKFISLFFMHVALLAFEAVNSQETCSGPSKMFSLSMSDLEDPSKFLEDVRLFVEEVTNKPTTPTPEVNVTANTEISNTLSFYTAFDKEIVTAQLTENYALTGTDITASTPSEVVSATSTIILTSLIESEGVATTRPTTRREGSTPSEVDTATSTIILTSLIESEDVATTTTRHEGDISTAASILGTKPTTERDFTAHHAEMSSTFPFEETTNRKPDFSEKCKVHDTTSCYWFDGYTSMGTLTYDAADKICQSSNGYPATFPNETVYNEVVLNIQNLINFRPLWLWTGIQINANGELFGDSRDMYVKWKSMHRCPSFNNNSIGLVSRKVAMTVEQEADGMQCQISFWQTHGVVCQLTIET